MNTGTIEISAADVDKCLQELRRPEPIGVNSLRHTFHRTACLLDTFTMPEVRQLAGLPPEADWVELSIDAELATPPPHSAAGWPATEPLRWRLRAEDRCRALLELRSDGKLSASWRDLPADGSPHVRFLRLALTASIRIRELDFDDTIALRNVLRWLHGSDLVDARMLQEADRHLDRLQLFRPFQALLAYGFAGRREELDRLKAFVFPQDQNFVRVVRNFSDDGRILLVYGPGGLGKSTLLARFLMDHCGPRAAEPVPFVYLDIDRHGFSTVHQVRLIIEALRQLNRQASTTNSFVDAEIVELLAVVNEAASSDAGARRLPQFELARRFGRALTAMTEFGDHPLVFVIDTFEEIQRRGIESENAAWSLLASLLQAVPTLRIILAGRSLLRERRCEAMSLRGLERSASEALIDDYIARRQLPALDLGERAQLLSTCRDNPLSLRLALRLMQVEQKKALDLSVGSWVLLQLSDERLQALLHCRVLSHIDDEEVRRLAYPGMAVRRITPEVIEQVLAGPCGIAIRDPEHAKSLFHRLKREVGLVEVDADGSLLHRNDVRAVVLESMDLGSAKQIREINLAAVAFHAQRTSTQSRAEEIYHRLRLEQPTEELDARWQDDIAALLGNALDELPAASHIYLASRLSYAVDKSLRERADQISWERLALHQAQNAFSRTAALQLLAERSERLPGSPLWEYEAELARSNSEFQRAATTVDRATRRGGFRPREMARLQLIGVLASEAMDEYRRARDYVNVLVELGELHSDTLLKIRAATCARRIDRMLYRRQGIEPPVDRRSARKVPKLLLRRNGTIDLRRLRQLASRPVLLREVAAEFGLANPDMLFFALDRLGLPGSGMGEWLETIKREVTLADLLGPRNTQRTALWSQLRAVLEEPLELKESWPAPATLIESLSDWIRHDRSAATLHRLLVEGFRSDIYFLIRNDEPAVAAAIRRLGG